MNRLIIPEAVERKLHAYVMSVDSEIAGMGKIKRWPDGGFADEQGDIYVEDVMIYDQEVTGGTADLSSEALAIFMTDLIKKKENPADWVLWWHSHHTMQAFFSTTDTGTIERSNEFRHIISLVVNRNRQRECRIDTHHPFRLTKEKVPIVVGTPSEEIPKEILDEVKAKVRIKTYAPVTPHRGYVPIADVLAGTKKELGRPHSRTGILSPSPRGKSSDDSFDDETRSIEVISLTGSPTELTDEDLDAAIQVSQERLKELRALGQIGSQEFMNLAHDLADYYIEQNTRLLLDEGQPLIGFKDRQ